MDPPAAGLAGELNSSPTITLFTVPTVAAPN